MKTHAIIPIFIPHKGCPNDCVFCNQRQITARNNAPSKEDVEETIQRNLKTISENANIKTKEIAFYGGSFTGLSIEEQNIYLDIALNYKEKGLIDKIHLSTRPDYIDHEILVNLKNHQVDIIELGVQSFDDEVLEASKRGHNAQIVYQSAKMIKDYGFVLGIQLMVGLPKDTLEKCIYSAKETVKINPSLCRIYPTMVFEDTQLLTMLEKGEYSPLNLDEAIKRCSAMYKILDKAGIQIMRVGLKSTDIVSSNNPSIRGDYHPAFRQLVEGSLVREELVPRLSYLNEKALLTNSKIKVDIFSNGKWFSNLIGNGGINREYFSRTFSSLNLKYKIDDSLKNGEFAVIEKE